MNDDELKKRLVDYDALSMSNAQVLANFPRPARILKEAMDEGIIKKDSIDITIQNCDDCRLFIPSAFTPNNDGLNDLFKARPECSNVAMQNFSLSVYNRWGQLVFLTNDINDGWDGTYRNKRLDQGVYVYLVKYSFKQAKLRQQKGTITLVR